jgi:hypothetical protein
VSEEADKLKKPPTNEIDDRTGQHDARFLLWRQFCQANGIPVESLPSELADEMLEKWEAVKQEQLLEAGNTDSKT